LAGNQTAGDLLISPMMLISWLSACQFTSYFVPAKLLKTALIV
jgi:hypothetical protein